MDINRHQVKGCVKMAKGAIKETTGRIVGNKTLQVRGQHSEKDRQGPGEAGRHQSTRVKSRHSLLR